MTARQPQPHASNLGRLRSRRAPWSGPPATSLCPAAGRKMVMSCGAYANKL
jgi:hypothetical protein